jgi:DNA-binding beta-propeller fold protein YncE
MSAQVATGSTTLVYVKTIGIANNSNNGRGFANPVSLAVSSDDRIFVLNRSDPVLAHAIRVGICTLEEEHIGEFGDGSGEGDTQFRLPTGIAFDSQDRLYVTDEYLNRVTVFDSSGHFLGKWGQSGRRDGQFNGPAGIAFNSADNAFVVDQHNNRVQKFNRDGEYLLQWGHGGSNAGELDLPWGVTVDSEDNVYVADWRNDRVQKFTPDGRFLAAFGEPGDGDGQFHRPSDVAVDCEGIIYVADWGNERVQVLAPNGAFQTKERGQATLSKWAEEFYASNPDESTTRDVSNLFPTLPDHSTPYQVSSQTEAYFWGPTSVTLDKEGRLYVTESNRHRVQVFQRR